MNEELPRKRTRSEMVGKDLLQEEEQNVRKKEIVEGENGLEVRDVPLQPPVATDKQDKAKLLKMKLKQLQDSKVPDQETETRNQASNDHRTDQKRQKHKKKKSKHHEKQNKQRKEGQKQANPKKKSGDNKGSQDDEIKQQDQLNGKHKKDNKEQKNTNKSGQKGRSSSKKKSKKSKTKQKDRNVSPQASKEKKIKKAQSQQQDPKEEQKSQKETRKQSKPEKSKKHKKKKKEQSEPEQELSEQEQKQEQQQEQEDESESQQDESGQKKSKKIKKIGRRPSGPVKRKKTSIFEQQQIINKKYRVKKKSHYLNKMSNRAWGPMRAGPYRQVPKPSKDEQRKIIDTLLGDGPKNQNSQSALDDKAKENSSVKLEAQQQANAEDEEKVEEEEEVQVKKSKSKNKKKKRDNESEEEKPKTKSKAKSKSKKKSKKKDQSDGEIDKQKSVSTMPRTKMSRSDTHSVKQESQAARSAKNQKKGLDKSQAGSENEAKIEQGGEKRTASKSKKKKKKNSDSEQSSNSEKGRNKSKSKSKKKTKRDVKHEGPKRVKTTKEQDHQFSKQDSEKVIGLFAADGGNYPQMMKQLPGIRLKKVRLHLRMLFHRALDIITYQVQHRCGRKIKEWEQDEKVEIVRELHRIRSSNRLLSQANVHFREKMTALMRSYHDESWLDTVSETDIETLYRRLEAFVRGYNTINRSKRTSAASMTEIKSKEKEQRYKFSKEVTRKPIICGGHLLSKGVKSQHKEEQDQTEVDDRSRSVIAPEKLVDDWNRQEEKTLCELYVNNQEADELICDKLKEQYGANAKWRDFEVLGRKIDQLIKFALIKLQNLTARPYCRIQRVRQLQRKRAKLQLKLKKEQDSERLTSYYKQKLRTTSMFLYDNEIFMKEERLEMKQRIFKNLSLLERQIFGHIESYKVKNALVRVLIDQFPTQEEVERAVREVKKFSRWAREEERTNHISSIKNIFVGEREDSIYREDDPNEDSIMVDIDKVEITRKNGVQQEERESDEGGDEKSVLFVGSRYGEENEPIEIENDGEVEVSDFEQPESVRSSAEEIEEVEAPVEPQFKMLEKLYETLNTNKPK